MHSYLKKMHESLTDFLSELELMQSIILL